MLKTLASNYRDTDSFLKVARLTSNNKFLCDDPTEVFIKFTSTFGQCYCLCWDAGYSSQTLDQGGIHMCSRMALLFLTLITGTSKCWLRILAIMSLSAKHKWILYSPDLNPLDNCVWSIVDREANCSNTPLPPTLRTCWKSLLWPW